MFKKIISLATLIIIILAFNCVDLRAGIQNNQAIPDEICILNNYSGPISVEGVVTEPGETAAIKVNTNTQDKGTLALRLGFSTFTLKFPTYGGTLPSGKTTTTALLDFNTIYWFATAQRTSLDEISIYNDSNSLITLMYNLNGLTPPQQIKPGLTKTKKVSVENEKKSGEKKGAILISDGCQSYTVEFLRRLYKKGMINKSDFNKVTLRLSTIQWFNNGFSVN